jgi:hypothetical protein
MTLCAELAEPERQAFDKCEILFVERYWRINRLSSWSIVDP